MGAPEKLDNAALHLTLQLDERQRQQLAEVGAIVTAAESYVIDCPEVASLANEELRAVITRKERIEAMRKDFVTPAQQIIENAKKWFSPSIDACVRAEAILKGKLSAWMGEQKRIADEHRRAAEAEARRLREDAERKAAAERARAEEAAAEARRKAADAAERERKAREEGNARGVAAAVAERARREEEERQRRAEGERRAQELEMAAAAAAPTTPTPEPTKVDGFSMRKNWIAELAPDCNESDAKLKIVMQIAKEARWDQLALLAIDWKCANKLAKALEDKFNVPGLKARNNPISTSRG